MDLRATLDYNLKRKIVQSELAKKKKKQLEDEEMTVAVIDVLQDVRMEIRDIEKDMKKQSLIFSINGIFIVRISAK
jgi:hypothetical protein